MKKRSLLRGIIFSGIFLWMGGQEVYTVLKNPNPLEVSCKDFTSVKEKGDWFKLKNCPVNLSEGVYFYEEKHPETIKEVYVPVIFSEGKDEEAVELVIASKKPEWIAIMNEISKISNDPEKLQAFYDKDISRIIFDMDIEGISKFGMNSSSQERRIFSEKADLKLKENFLVLEHNKKPSLGFGLTMSSFGFAILGFTGIRWIRRRY